MDGMHWRSIGVAMFYLNLRKSDFQKKIILAPDYLFADELGAERLIRLLPEYTTQETPVYAVNPHSRYLSAKTRTFIDFLAARFAHLPQIKHDGLNGGSNVRAE
jgi:DNA-binding transcriptional LysR family regulator